LVWTTCCWLSPLGITLGDVIAAVHSNEPALVCSPQSKPWMDKCACNCKRGLLSSLL
jgi:hypothetical protein